MKKFSLIVLVLLLLLALPVTAQESDPSSPALAQTLAWIEYYRNGGMAEFATALYSDTDYFVHLPGSAQGAANTVEAIIADEQVLHGAFPDIRIDPYLVLVEGGTAAFVGFQQGTFTNEYYGTPATGAQLRANMLSLTYVVDGKATRDYGAWNQQYVLEFFGFAPAEYNFEMQPWDVRLGTTSTTPEEHHAALAEMYANVAEGAVEEAVLAYANGVLIHDYLQDTEGVDAAFAMYQSLVGLPDFRTEETNIVCEGDLCITFVIDSFAGETDRTYLLWAALQRFEDGKIVEEWWQYDNTTLWSVVTPA
jgi:predicted ester cyclase